MPTHARRGGEGRTSLVVDDDPKVLGYVRGILEDGGCYPIVTGDAEEVARPRMRRPAPIPGSANLFTPVEWSPSQRWSLRSFTIAVRVPAGCVDELGIAPPRSPSKIV